MEFLQLVYFCSAAETENFAKTAKDFNVPATGISQSIRRLEKELGVTLFDRTANQVKLNARGRLFYQNVRSGMDILEGAQRKVRDDGVEGTIRLLVKANRNLVLKTMARFLEKYKHVSFDIDLEPDGDLGKYDLIITDNFYYREDYRRSGLLDEAIVLAMPKNHPLANKEDLAVADLKKEPFLCYHEGNGMNRLTTSICAKADFSPRMALLCDDLGTLARCIELGIGVAMVPEVAFQEYLSDKLCLRDITGFRRPTVVCYDKRKLMSTATRVFLDMLHADAKEATGK